MNPTIPTEVAAVLSPPEGDTFTGWAAWLRDRMTDFDPYVQRPHGEKLAAWLDGLSSPAVPVESQQRDALLAVMRACDAAKQPCGSDPESSTAIRNSTFASVAAIAAQGLAIIKGPSPGDLPASVPDGWQLVPVTPRLGMLDALSCAMFGDARLTFGDRREQFRRGYAAMLAESPQPPTNQEGAAP